MMKHLFFLALIGITSCGEMKKSTGTSLRATRTINPVVVSVSEKARIQTICNALNAKVQALTQTNTQTFTYTLTQKSCSVDNIDSGTSSQVTVGIDLNGFKFVRQDSGFFPYGVETTQAGLMSEVCSGLDGLTSPKISNGRVIEFSSSRVDNSECSDSANELCMVFELGQQSGETYTVQTREVMKFQINPNLARYGFFTDRRTSTSLGCGTDETSFTRAILNN